MPWEVPVLKDLALESKAWLDLTKTGQFGDGKAWGAGLLSEAAVPSVGLKPGTQLGLGASSVTPHRG